MTAGKKDVNPLKNDAFGTVAGKFAFSEEVRDDFFRDKFNFWVLIACFLFLLAQILLIAIFWHKLPPDIPIFWSKPWGQAILGKTFFILLIPALALVSFLINAVFVIGLKKDKFLSRVLTAGSLIVGFCTFYGVVKIITLLT